MLSLAQTSIKWGSIGTSVSACLTMMMRRSLKLTSGDSSTNRAVKPVLVQLAGTMAVDLPLPEGTLPEGTLPLPSLPLAVEPLPVEGLDEPQLSDDSEQAPASLQGGSH